jgi:hypothetical protein
LILKTRNFFLNSKGEIRVNDETNGKIKD